MRGVRKGAAALRREEGGLTLIELMVAATLGLIVVGGALGMFMSSLRSEPRTASKVTAIQQGRTTVERITRELRQGTEVPTATSSQLAIETYVRAASCGGEPASTSIRCRVTYNCSGNACTRAVSPPGGGVPGSATQVVSGLTGPNVFSYSYLPEAEEPSYVGVELALSTGDGVPVTLEDGVALRNSGEEEGEA